MTEEPSEVGLALRSGVFSLSKSQMNAEVVKFDLLLLTSPDICLHGLTRRRLHDRSATIVAATKIKNRLI